MYRHDCWTDLGVQHPDAPSSHTDQSEDNEAEESKNKNTQKTDKGCGSSEVAESEERSSEKEAGGSNCEATCPRVDVSCLVCDEKRKRVAVTFDGYVDVQIKVFLAS